MHVDIGNSICLAAFQGLVGPRGDPGFPGEDGQPSYGIKGNAHF